MSPRSSWLLLEALAVTRLELELNSGVEASVALEEVAQSFCGPAWKGLFDGLRGCAQDRFSQTPLANIEAIPEHTPRGVGWGFGLNIVTTSELAGGGGANNPNLTFAGSGSTLP